MTSAYYGVARDGDFRFVYIVPEEDLQAPAVTFCTEVVSCHKASAYTPRGGTCMAPVLSYAQDLASRLALPLIDYRT